MKVHSSKPVVSIDPKVQSQKAAEGTRPGPETGERISMSRQAQEAMQIDQRRIREVLATLPDVREDKVAEIKKAIEEGRYDPPADKVAEKMLRTFLVESLYRK